MKAVVTINDETPPRRLLAELTTAHAIDRVFPLSGRGAFSFSVVATDPGATRDNVREGRVVVIWSDTDTPPYVGFIQQVMESPGGRTLDVTGDNLAAVLYERQLPLDCIFEDQAAGGIAAQMLSLVNSANPTHVWPLPSPEPGSPVRGSFEAGGSMLGDALDELAERTGDEWWLEQIVTRRRIEVYLRWGRRRGLDRSRTVHLQEGVHFTEMGYGRDALGYAQSVAVLGGGAAVADRPAAVRAFNRPSGASSKGTLVGSASEVHVRSRSTSPMLAREVVEVLPLDTDEAMLADAAQRAMERPATEAESLTLAINSVLSWGAFGPGDIVTAVLANAGGLAPTSRLIAGYQEENYTTGYVSVGTTTLQRGAQGIKVPRAARIAAVSLYLRTVGTPVDGVKVELMTDAAGLPSETVVQNGTSHTVDVTAVPAAFGWVTFAFPIPPLLEVATQYHIVLSRTGALSDANYYRWANDPTSPAYADGTVEYYEGVEWIAQARDAVFKVYERLDLPVGVNRRIRVLALDPDEDRGQLDLVVSVQT